MIKYYKLFLTKKKSKKVIMPSLCAVFLVSTGFVAVITIKSDTPSHPIRTWTTRIELDFFVRGTVTVDLRTPCRILPVMTTLKNDNLWSTTLQLI